MNNTEEQIQTIRKLPDEERKQVTKGSSPDTNSTEVEMINSTRNSGAPNTPTYTCGNEDLRNELDTLSSSSKTVDRSSAHSEFHSMETATKATQPEDTD
ncbi:11627_t:CDS:2, partial [Gigaspora rosea]